jgi:hypothetical protein
LKPILLKLGKLSSEFEELELLLLEPELERWWWCLLNNSSLWPKSVVKFLIWSLKHLWF